MKAQRQALLRDDNQPERRPPFDVGGLLAQLFTPPAEPEAPPTPPGNGWLTSAAGETLPQGMTPQEFPINPNPEPHPIGQLLDMLQPGSLLGAAGSRVRAMQEVEKRPELAGQEVPGALEDMLALVMATGPGYTGPKAAKNAKAPKPAAQAVKPPVEPPAAVGQPAYHGTGAVFEDFNEGSRGGLYGSAPYFTDNPVIASQYAEASRGRPNVRVEKLDIKHPFDTRKTLTLDELRGLPETPLNNPADYDLYTRRPIELPTGKEYFDSLAESFSGTGDTRTIYDQAGNLIDTGRARAADVIRDSGYDSIIYQGGELSGGTPHMVYVALDPKIIVKGKSISTPSTEPFQPPMSDDWLKQINIEKGKAARQEMLRGGTEASSGFQVKPPAEMSFDEFKAYRIPWENMPEGANKEVLAVRGWINARDKAVRSIRDELDALDAQIAEAEDAYRRGTTGKWARVGDELEAQRDKVMGRYNDELYRTYQELGGKEQVTGKPIREPAAVKPAAPPVAPEGAAGGMPPIEPPAPPTGGMAVEPLKTGPIPGLTTDVDIVMRKMQTPDELWNFVRGQTEARAPKIQAQRRGVIPLVEQERMGRELGMTADQFAKTPAGKAFNTEQIHRAGDLVVTARKEFLDAKAQAQATDSSANLINMMAKLEKYNSIYQTFYGVRAEAGRSVAAFRRLMQVVDNPTDVNIDRAMKALGGREMPEEVLRKLRQIDPTDTEAIMRFVRQNQKFSTWDKIHAYFIANILSGTGTHLRNIASNTLFGGPWEMSRRYVRGLADVPISRLEGRQREFYSAEALPSVMGYLHGFPEGLRKWAYIMKNGFDIDDAAKLEATRFPEFTGVMKLWNTPSRLLVGADAMAKTMGFESEIWAQATRKAIKEGLRGEAKAARIAELKLAPTDDMVEAARKFSHMATFTNDPDKIARWALRGKADVPGLRYITPFINTPWNLTKRGAELTPLGLVNLRKAGPERAEVLSKAIMGSGVMLGAAAMYANGDLTGAPPENQGERDLFYRLGKQPYSIKIGDSWVKYQILGPLFFPFAAAAGIGDAFTKNPKADFWKQAAIAASTVGESIIDQSFFSALSGLMDAVRDPVRFGGRTIENIAAGMLPFSSLQAAVGRAFDPYIRQPENILQAIEARIPGVSRTMPTKVTALGQPATRGASETVAGGLVSALGPAAMAPARQNPVDVAFEESGVAPGFVGKSLTVNNKKIELTPDQQRQFQEITGKLIEARVKALLPRVKNMTAEKRQDTIERAVDKARMDARARFIRVLKGGKASSATRFSISDNILNTFPIFSDKQQPNDILSAFLKP